MVAVSSILTDALMYREQAAQLGGKKRPEYLMVEAHRSGLVSWWWRPAALACTDELRDLARRVDDLVVVEFAGEAIQDPNCPGVYVLPIAWFRVSEVKTEYVEVAA